MTAFYRDVMGLTPVEATRTDNWVEFDGGAIRFALHAIPAEIAKDIHFPIRRSRANRAPASSPSRSTTRRPRKRACLLAA
jgi:hypothetical protein